MGFPELSIDDILCEPSKDEVRFISHRSLCEAALKYSAAEEEYTPPVNEITAECMIECKHL